MNIHPMIFVGLESTQILKPNELLSRAMNLICEQKGVAEQDVLSNSRAQKFVMARHEFCYIARTKTNLSLSFIGVLLGGKDHATVIHSAKTFKNLLDTDKKVRQKHFDIMHNLNFKIN